MNKKLQRRCDGCDKVLMKDSKKWKKYGDNMFHSFDCAENFALTKVKQIRTKRKKQQKKDWNVRREKMLGIRHQEKLTQAVVNKYVRMRDKFYNRNCISCDNPLDFDPINGGSRVDAGHYKTQKAHPEIRFNVSNINAECVSCNRHNTEHLVGMVVNIAKRYGRDRLDWLNGHHELKKYTIEDHKRMREIFNKRIKRYLK